MIIFKIERNEYGAPTKLDTAVRAIGAGALLTLGVVNDTILALLFWMIGLIFLLQVITSALQILGLNRVKAYIGYLKELSQSPDFMAWWRANSSIEAELIRDYGGIEKLDYTPEVMKNSTLIRAINGVTMQWKQYHATENPQ